MIIREDGWVLQMETSPHYVQYTNHLDKSAGDPFDPAVYKSRFRKNDFIKFQIRVKRVIKTQHPSQLLIKLKCNQCAGKSNGTCYRIAKIMPYRDDRAIVYTSVKKGTCKTFDKLNAA